MKLPPEAIAKNYCRYGGTIGQIPKPRLRRYTRATLKQHGLKRPVEVGMHIYYGIGRHYYTSIKEADNPIWDAKEQTWATPWKDRRGKGRFFSDRFDNILDAKRWIAEMLKKHFPADRYDIKDSRGRKRWFYREGD